MSERWIQESEQLLRTMKTLFSKDEKDRLEIINSILFAINTLERSMRGWKLWVRNLSLMSKFGLEELLEIEKALEEQIRPFVEYDIEATKKWKDKFPRIQVISKRKRKKAGVQGMYV